MYKVGDVFRPENAWTFGDSVIVSINQNGTYKLHRPYMYATGFGTSLMGYETIDGITGDVLLSHWKKIDKGRTT
jgi:hypothetical protein